jgi:hypothetical protein
VERRFVDRHVHYIYLLYQYFYFCIRDHCAIAAGHEKMREQGLGADVTAAQQGRCRRLTGACRAIGAAFTSETS